MRRAKIVCTLGPASREPTFIGNLIDEGMDVARIGYQALFLTGVAVASDNIQTNNVLLANGPAVVNARSNAVFHGPMIGVGGNW